jgi:hypothetical protein
MEADSVDTAAAVIWAAVDTWAAADTDKFRADLEVC